MKRELERISGADSVDVDSPRAKRRKETAQAAMPATTSKSNNVASDPSAIKFKQDAFSLWSTVKDATNKEGRLLSTEFMRLPSKRQYADYYQQIQNPIALDEIKSRIETGKYPSLDAVRQDLELCFKNAKKYNMKDSPIWKDAKHLHKLVNKEYVQLTGVSPEEVRAADAENDGDAGSGDEGGKKKKTPNLPRMLKSRLQKLVDKTDDDGRVISAEFMELPSKKLWPGYYKVIKKPQCFENIFKKLKRKEYHTSAEFSKDVQLVFLNAVEFNSEGSQIHEDAQTLKSYFHQLMSDLPAPHSLPEYSTSTGTSKITLRLPGTGAASTTNAAASTPVKGGSVMLRVPGLPKDASATTASKAAEPETSTSVPSTTTRSRAAKEEATTAEPIPIQPAPSTSKTTTSTTATTTGTQLPRKISTTTTSTAPVQTATQPVAPIQTYPTHYPNAPYQQPMGLSRPTSATPSTTQHATSTSYTPATILPAYPAYTNTGYTPSTTTTPLNPLSNLNNYGYAYGGAGFGPGATGTTSYSTTNGISYANATYVSPTTATTSSTPGPYYHPPTTGTTGTQNANPNVNAVTAPAVTKTPVPVPLRTFKTVLLTTRACDRRLELDAREGVKVWSVRLLNKEKGLRISGVKFDVPPRSAVNSISKTETGGGGQEEEEEGDVKMNEDKDPEEEHEDDVEYEAEPSPAKRGVKGKRKGKGKGKVGRPKKVKVAPAPPVPVTPTTPTVPSVSAVLGEEDVTVKINNTVVPLRSPISASTETDDGSDEEDEGDGEAPAMNGKENKKKQRWEWDVDVPLGSSVLEISEKGGAVWKVYVDRNFLLDGP